jgi:hypothetical protein
MSGILTCLDKKRKREQDNGGSVCAIVRHLAADVQTVIIIHQENSFKKIKKNKKTKQTDVIDINKPKKFLFSFVSLRVLLHYRRRRNPIQRIPISKLSDTCTHT